MSVTIHNIVVGVGAGTNIQAEINKMMNKLKTNLEVNQEDFIEFVTKQTKYIAKLEVKRFAFKGDLENGIAHRVFKKNKMGEVFIKSDQQQKAIMNEFGQIPPRFIPNTGKVTEWVNQKAPKLMGMKMIPVGFSGRGSHVIAPNPRNRFWGITQQIVEKDIDNMFAHYLTKAIEKS